MKKILMTGFMPFGGEKVNPSWMAVEKVQVPDQVQLIREELPVEYLAAAEKVRALMDMHAPDCVILVGQAGGRKAVSVEQVAVNLMDSMMPDNGGFKAVDLPVCPEGPAAYFSTLPVKKLVQAMKDAGVQAVRSLTAGSYVCNCTLYAALHHAKQENLQAECCFIHVPFIPEQTVGKEAPSMPLEEIVTALEAALKALAA